MNHNTRIPSEIQAKVAAAIPFFPESIGVRSIEKLTGFPYSTIWGVVQGEGQGKYLICEDCGRLSRLKSDLSNVR
jgi:hypothetical protein